MPAKRAFHMLDAKDPAANLMVEPRRAIWVAVLLVTVLSGLPALAALPASLPALVTALFLLLLYGVAYLNLRRGRLQLASLVICAALWGAVTLVTLFFGAGSLEGFSIFLVVVLVSTLLLGTRGGLFFAILSLLTGLSVMILKELGFLISPPLLEPVIFVWAGQAAIFIAAALLFLMAYNSLRAALADARGHESRLERRAAQIQVAAEIAREASTVGAVDQLLQRAVDLISERFGFYYAGIYLAEESEPCLALRAASGEGGRRLVESAHRLQIGGPGVVGFAAQALAPRVVADANADPLHLQNRFLPNTRSELALPMQVERRIVGVLDVQSEMAAAFDLEDIAVLQVLAGQLATAIQNTRLFEAVQRQLDELKVLHAVTVACAEILDEDELIASVTHTIEAAFFPDNFGILMLDPALGALITHPSYHERPEISKAPVPLGQGIIGRVALSGQPARLDDVTQDPGYLCLDPATRSELCVPLKAGGRILGVINTESEKPADFTSADERLLVTLASQVATAIEKIRLMRASRRQLDEMALLLQASVDVSNTLSVEDVLTIMAQRLLQALRADACSISSLDREQDALVTILDYTISPDAYRDPPGIVYPLKLYPASRQLIEERKPFSVRVCDPNADPSEKQWMLEQGYRAVLIVPLVAHDHVLGTVEMMRIDDSQDFTSEETGLCLTMAGIMAAGLENARLFEAEHRRSAELEALRQASLQITSSLQWQTVLETLISQATTLIDAADGHFFLYDGESITFGAALWDNQFQPQPVWEPRPNGLVYTVARSGNRVVIDDTRDHPLYAGTSWRGAILGLPLRSGSSVLGVMTVAHEKPHKFTTDELLILELLADQATIALENVRLYAETQRRAEALANALHRLEELDRLKNEFVQNVSHELRTPLAIVRGYTEMFDNGELGELSDEQRGPMSIIARRVRILSKMIDDLLAILESETHARNVEPVDLSRLAILVQAEFQNAAQQAGLTLTAEIAPDLPTIPGNSLQLRRVLDNLIGNAIKFTQPGGTIRLCISYEEDELALDVSDTGIGIHPDDLPHIFERFFQVDGSSTRRYGGTGLGLALVREIVEAHGGRVSVESVLHQGSTFHVRLPVNPPPHRAPS